MENMKLTEKVNELEDDLIINNKKLKKAKNNFSNLFKISNNYISSIKLFKKILKNSQNFFIKNLNNLE